MGRARAARPPDDDLYATLARIAGQRNAKPRVVGDLAETGHPLAGPLEELRGELLEVLRAIREEFAGRMENPFRGLSVESGKLPSEVGTVPFLFLRVPGAAGFLMEPLDGDTLEIYRATEARPLMRNENTGSAERAAVFSRRGPALFHLVSLEPGLWRLQREGALWDTKTTPRVAESLTARVVQEMASL